MKKTGRKSIGWIAGLLVPVMIIGVILSWESVWASDKIEDYTIKLSKALKGVEITATGSSGEKSVKKTDGSGEAVFTDFFEVGGKYTLTVNLGADSDYYLKGASVEKEGEEPETVSDTIKIKKEGYSLKLKASADQSVELDLEEMEEKKLSELAALTPQGGGDKCLSSDDEKGIFIYNNKTSSVKVEWKGESVAEIGYKTNEEEDVKTYDGSSFEIEKSTGLTELHVKEKEDDSGTLYKLNPEAWIVIDNTPPVVTLGQQGPIYTNEEKTKIKFSVKNKSDASGQCSEIDKVYYCEKGDKEKKQDITVEMGTDGKGTFNIANETEGTKTYQIYAVDEAGNESAPAEVVVCYDITPPEIVGLSMSTESGGEITYDESASKSCKPITLTVETKDDLSGVDSITLETDQEPKKAQKDGKTFKFTEIGKIEKIKTITCKDRAGNKLEKISFLGLIGDEKVNKKIKSDGILVRENVKVNISTNVNAETEEAADQIYVLSHGDKEGETKKVVVADPANKKLEVSVEEPAEDGKNRMGILSIQVGNKKSGEPWSSGEYPESVPPESGSPKTESIPLSELKLQEGDNTIEITVTMHGGEKKTSELVIQYDNQPPIINIEEIKICDSGTGTALKGIAPEVFSNKKVKIIVTVGDESAVASIALFTGGKWLTSQKVETTKDGSFTAEFEIDVENDPKEYSFSAKATDCVNNECGKTPEAATHLILEKKAPDITISLPDAAYGTAWYGGNTAFTVAIRDENSGLSNVRAVLNDKEVRKIQSDYEKEKTCTDTLIINTSEAKREKDGSYNLAVTVTDNAGNERTMSQKIYVDTANPEIVSFEFEAEGYKEGEKTDFGVNKRDYGYYFKEKTKVTIRAKDPSPSSGLASITYYTVNKDGKKSEAKTEAVSSSGSITFYIPANFKGQIYAKPADHVNHSPGDYVTPDSTVIENSAQHKEDSAIIFSRAKTSKKDARGQALYKKDVAVRIKVSDRYSGIRKVEYSVTAPYDTGKNQKGIVEIDNKGDKKDQSASGWERTGREKNLVTELTGNIKVSNNSNDIVLTIKMTDRAGHVSTEKDKFSIDKTNPVIQVSYDNNKSDKEFKNFYKERRTATIVVTERNFDAGLVKYAVSNKDGEPPAADLTEGTSWRKKADKKDPDKTTYTAKVPFAEDGKYTWSISLKDRAGNEAAKVGTQKFTIDQTAPVITVTYDNEAAENIYYYKKERLATITIEEHNFEEGRIKITGSGNDDGRSVSFPPVSAWLHDGDSHTATILYSQDAEYFFQIAYTDQAGNEALAPPEDHFFIDQTLPEVSLTGVGNKSANRGKVIPVVTYTDVNLSADTLKLSLRGANRGEVEVQGESREIKNGAVFTFKDFEKKKENDDIYTLDVSVKDKAGNESIKKTLSFSVNRFGSTYRFETEPLTSIVTQTQKGGVSYNQNEFDVVLKEVNVDELNKEAPRIRLLKNGTSTELKEGPDGYSVEYTGGGKKWSKREWSEYTYTIGQSHFSRDGMYEVEVSSRDQAGNKNENVEKKASIQFVIDKTAPVIIPVDLENDVQYPLESKEVKIAVKDNFVTPDVKIYLNDREIQHKAEGENYSLTIPSAGVKQNLRIVANDSAGNEKTVVVEDFLVSTNLFVRWYNNLPLFAGSLAGFGVLVVLIIVLIIVRRMRRKEETH